MDDRVVQFRVGVTVLAALIITGILTLLFGELPSLVRGTYTVYIKFPSAPGVSADTPIRKSGILVGRVDSVNFMDEDDRGNQVVVTATLDKGVSLYTDEVVAIRTGFIGDAQLEFVPGAAKVQGPRVPIQPDDRLQGLVQRNPLESLANLEGNLNMAASSLAGAGTQVGSLAKNLNELLEGNEERVNRIIAETETTMKLFQKSLATIDEVVGDPKVKEDLKVAVAALPNLMSETQTMITGMQKTIALADDNLRNLQTFTKAVDERGEGMINNVAQSVERLDELLGQVNRFSRALNSREGSLGQLINNPELYNNLSQAAANINKLTRDLQPIIADARVLTDKVARHPGVIVRDAIKPGPGLK